MDLTPQVLHDAEFREARRGGYDTRDVDEFLERVAGAVSELNDRLRDALQRTEAAEARAADAERRAAEGGGGSGSSEAEETLKRTLVLAQRTADAAIREAQEEAAQAIAAAREEAERTLGEAREQAVALMTKAEDDARRGAEQARDEVLTEVRALEQSRETLHADAQTLQTHLEAQRERLQAAVQQISSLLADSGPLRSATIPPLASVDVPSGDDVVPVDTTSGDATESPGGDWAFLDEPRDEQPSSAEPIDVLAERDLGDDAYLAELRKAMTDQTPLGPSEDEGDDSGGIFDTEPRRRERSRFGRRS